MSRERFEWLRRCRGSTTCATRYYEIGRQDFVFVPRTDSMELYHSRLQERGLHDREQAVAAEWDRRIDAFNARGAAG